MSTLLQISDTHFGTERPAVVEALVALVHRLQPEVLLLSGDITQRATKLQFDAARQFVDRLAVPRVLTIPGNHDIPLFNLAARAFAPYARQRHAFGEQLEPEHVCDRWLVLALNTTRPWRHKHGTVSQQQIERVAQRMQQASPAQLRVVVVHQPVAVPRHAEDNNLLRGHERAVRAWAAAGVDLVVGGHIHLPYVLPLHERMRGLGGKIWAVQAGTAVSRRVRFDAGNSVNLIESGPTNARARACVIQRFDYIDQQREFKATTRDELHCGTWN